MNDKHEFCGFDIAKNQPNNSVDDEFVYRYSADDYFDPYPSKKSKERKKSKKAMKKMRKEIKKLDGQFGMLCGKMACQETVLEQHTIEIGEMNEKVAKLESDVNALKRDFREDKINRLILTDDISERRKIAQELLLAEEV